MQRLAVTVLSLVAILASGACGHTHSKHSTKHDKPTPNERRAIITATRAEYNGTSARSIVISISNRSWARAVLEDAEPPQYVLLKREKRNHWSIAYMFDRGLPADGTCAYAPAKIVQELFRMSCPSWNALHARKADEKESKNLVSAYAKAHAARIKEWRSSGLRPLIKIERACISRLNASWATGSIVISGSPVGAQFFSRADDGRWRYRVRASNAIVLSLARCGGFNAELYFGTNAAK